VIDWFWWAPGIYPGQTKTLMYCSIVHYAFFLLFLFDYPLQSFHLDAKLQGNIHLVILQNGQTQTNNFISLPKACWK